MLIFFQSLARIFGRGASRRGFTLLELLAVVTIIVVVTSILLVRQSQFNSSTLLRSLSYSIALSVRQAQVYGTSIFGTETEAINCIGGTYSAGSCFASGYGVSFSSGETSSYVLFGDLNGNGRYDGGEEVETLTLGSGYRLSRFCASRTASNAQDCWPTGVSGGSDVTSLSIIFKRPNPDACFSTDTSPSVCAGGASPVYASSTVQITGGSGAIRNIAVTSTGQITVCPTNQSC